MLRTEQGPPRRLWSAGYELLFRRLGASLLQGRDGGVFVGGSFGHGEPVFGISDVDMIVVLAGSGGVGRERTQRRWLSLLHRFPFLSLLVCGVYVYEEPELRAAASQTCMTYGADGSGRSAFLGKRPEDAGGLLVRPGLWPTQEWRLVSGRDYRPGNVASDPQHRRLAAWLELQFWWRFAFTACLEPASPHAPFMCVKLVAEPARIWLWLTRGEQLFPRRSVFERALECIPEEEAAIRLALRLHDTMARSPEPPLAEVLPCFVRLSSRIAAHLAEEIASEGATGVRLVGGETELVAPAEAGASLLPLLDWRARVNPGVPDETFVLGSGDPADPAVLAAAAGDAGEGPYVALQADGLLVQASPPRRAQLRSVQCAATDPVSFALVERRDIAAFPNVAGWSVGDSARRAVGEHRAWLDSAGRSGMAGGSARSLGTLLSAARAALFLESVEQGDPELALTVAKAADLLGARLPGAHAVAEEALGSYRAARLEGAPVDTRTVSALLGCLRRLPAYAH